MLQYPKQLTPAMANLRTANQILAHFRNHPQVAVTRLMGTYQVWKRTETGKLDGPMATYDLAELKGWAARW